MKRILSIVLFVELSAIVFSQECTISFVGETDGLQYQQLSSVRVRNISRGWTVTIDYPDTVLVLNFTQNVLGNESKVDGFEQNVPNPFDCYTTVDLTIPQYENVDLQLFDANGKLCSELKLAIDAGSHRFEISASKPQTYILKAIAGQECYSVRMLNVGSGGCDGIEYGGYVGVNTKLTVENEYMLGDNMEYVGYAIIDDRVVGSRMILGQLEENQDVILEFITETTGETNGHEWVDLGLPSGTRWAIANVGADSPEDIGYYISWGETAPKDIYLWNTYKLCMGSYNALIKYCNAPEYGSNGYTDDLSSLVSSDDVATSNWGAGWRMPTQAEVEELLSCCTNEWISRPGASGRLFVGPNGNSVFLPYAEHRDDSGTVIPGCYSYYWSSSFDSDYPYRAWALSFNPVAFTCGAYSRYYGFPVRPVCQ